MKVIWLMMFREVIAIYFELYEVCRNAVGKVQSHCFSKRAVHIS